MCDVRRLMFRGMYEYTLARRWREGWRFRRGCVGSRINDMSCLLWVITMFELCLWLRLICLICSMYSTPHYSALKLMAIVHVDYAMCASDMIKLTVRRTRYTDPRVRARPFKFIRATDHSSPSSLSSHPLGTKKKNRKWEWRAIWCIWFDDHAQRHFDIDTSLTRHGLAYMEYCIKKDGKNEKVEA